MGEACSLMSPVAVSGLSVVTWAPVQSLTALFEDVMQRSNGRRIKSSSALIPLGEARYSPARLERQRSALSGAFSRRRIEPWRSPSTGMRSRPIRRLLWDRGEIE